MSLRTLVAAAVLVTSVVTVGGCARFDPTPPPPIRPTDRNVVLAWTIEEGLYDNGLARATEIIQFRYQGASSEEGITEVQDFGRLYRGDERPRQPTFYRHRLTRAQMDQLQHVLAGLELPDVERRQRTPDLVPWTMWGICVPRHARHPVRPAADRRVARHRRRARPVRAAEFVPPRRPPATRRSDARRVANTRPRAPYWGRR
jgi:hypothetical protein